MVYETRYIERINQITFKAIWIIRSWENGEMLLTYVRKKVVRKVNFSKSSKSKISSQNSKLCQVNPSRIVLLVIEASGQPSITLKLKFWDTLKYFAKFRGPYYMLKYGWERKIGKLSKNCRTSLDLFVNYLAIGRLI